MTADDLREVIASLIGTAKAGDTQAVKVLLDRVLGPSVPLDVLERLERLEPQLTTPNPKERPR